MALSPQEDEELRRIHTLAQFGALPDTMQARYSELCGSADQISIPEPTIDVTWTPANRRAHADDDITLYEDVDMAAVYAGLDNGPRNPNPRSMSIAAMAEFEAALTGIEDYDPSPHTGGFAPSTWYGRTNLGLR
jgi:hypothetical protein